MVDVMHWVIRAQRKEQLTSSSSISLSVDDRAEYRILRYSASFGSLSSSQQTVKLDSSSSLQDWCNGMQPLTSQGVLGIFRSGGDVEENTIQLHDQDKSQRMADSVLELLRRACMDTEGAVDEQALAAILSRVRHFCADQGGSVQKAGQILASNGRLGNLLWISADGAHQIRIASKDPLLLSFGVAYFLLFGAISL